MAFSRRARSEAEGVKSVISFSGSQKLMDLSSLFKSFCLLLIHFSYLRLHEFYILTCQKGERCHRASGATRVKPVVQMTSQKSNWNPTNAFHHVSALLSLSLSCVIQTQCDETHLMWVSFWCVGGVVVGPPPRSFLPFHTAGCVTKPQLSGLSAGTKDRRVPHCLSGTENGDRARQLWIVS